MESTGLASALIGACKQLSILRPTPIQQELIPPILASKNCLGIAPTGSGKTAAYCLPVLQNLSQDPYGVYGIVLLPTKELALQVHDQFRLFSSVFGLENHIQLIMGGVSRLNQVVKISQKPYIIISTPGRLLSYLDLIAEDRKSIFGNLHVVILDEADSLLQDSLRDITRQIISKVAPGYLKQFILVTATLTPRVSALVREIEDARNPNRFFLIDLTPQASAPVATMEHKYILVPLLVKLHYLVYLVENDFSQKRMIIFTKTCQSAQLMTTLLQRFDISATTLHSVLDVKRRLAHLMKFKALQSKILIATDLASRGLDLPKVDVVINYDFPSTFENYVHRSGRCARAGASGMTLSFITQNDNVDHILDIERQLHEKLQLHPVAEEEVVARMPSITKKLQDAKQILHEAHFFDIIQARKQLRRRSGRLKRRHLLGNHRRSLRNAVLLQSESQIPDI